MKLTSTAVYHTNPVHPNAPGAAPFPKDHWLQLSGEQMLAGFFKGRDNFKYFMIVNCDHTQARSTDINMNNKIKTVQKLSKKNGEWENISLKDSKNSTFSLNISEGNGELFRVLNKN